MPSLSFCKQHHPLHMQVTAGWSSAKNKEKTGIKHSSYSYCTAWSNGKFLPDLQCNANYRFIFTAIWWRRMISKTNNSKMGNLTQQHRGLAEYRVQPTTYTQKKLSNTTAEQKHCLPKDVWSQEGKTHLWTCWKWHMRKDNCWQSQPHLPSYPQIQA